MFQLLRFFRLDFCRGQAQSWPGFLSPVCASQVARRTGRSPFGFSSDTSQILVAPLRQRDVLWADSVLAGQCSVVRIPELWGARRGQTRPGRSAFTGVLHRFFVVDLMRSTVSTFCRCTPGPRKDAWAGISRPRRSRCSFRPRCNSRHGPRWVAWGW